MHTQITSIKDNVMNEHSHELMKQVINADTDMMGAVEIEQNPNSGYIYAADENGECYLFPCHFYSRNPTIERFISCPECGYENFVFNFAEELDKDNECCQKYAVEAGCYTETELNELENNA